MCITIWQTCFCYFTQFRVLLRSWGMACVRPCWCPVKPVSEKLLLLLSLLALNTCSCVWRSAVSVWKWNKQKLHELSSPSAVTRRCLPALGTRKKNGVVVVGNETTIDTGEGTTVNATDVLEASKWVIVWQRITCTHKICQRYKNVNQSDCVVVNMLWNDQEMVLKCIYRYINLMISD